MWEQIPLQAKKRRMIFILGLSWCSPRLPIDVRRLLTPLKEQLQIAQFIKSLPVKASSKRKKSAFLKEKKIVSLKKKRTRSSSIADPERLAKQLQIMFSTRNNFSRLRYCSHVEWGCPVRRRSFDLGEVKDVDEGVLDRLGYRFECPQESFRKIEDLEIDAYYMQEKMERRWPPHHLQEEFALSHRLYLPKNWVLQTSLTDESAEDNQTMRFEKGTEYWKEYFDEASAGRPYYVSGSTGESRWEEPAALEDGRKVVVLKRMYDVASGLWYYNDDQSGQSIWATLPPR